VIPVYPLPGYDQTSYYDLYDVLKNVVASDDPAKKVAMQSGDMANVFPTKKVSIKVNIEEAKKTLKLNPGDTIVGEMKLDINKNYLQKNDLALLAVLASNKWERPVYVTSTAELRNLGLEKYARMEGLTYRIVPVENSQVAVDVAFQNVMKFVYGGANKQGVYFDEENRRHINSIRQTHAVLAKFLTYNGKKDSAVKILNRYDQAVLDTNVPYGMTSNRGNFHNDISKEFLEAAYLAGDLKLAKKVHASLKKDLEQQMKYYRSLGENNMNNDQLAMQAAQLLNNKPGDLSQKQEAFIYDIYTSYQMLRELEAMEQQFGPAKSSMENAPVDLPNPVDSEQGKGGQK
jgi:hypothetical protein